MLFQKFLKYIAENNLFTKSDEILVGVSGGADSVFLVHLLLDAGFSFAIAHVNFNLRGEDSENDRIFVENLAEKHNIQIYCKSVDTIKYAEENNISIEMAARDIRYEWFAELLENEKFNYIATAHHQDDDIETYLINISRGTGIRGLSGISPKKGNLVRPLLFTNKVEITDYLNKNKIAFRTDLSNFENVYSRNKIRNIIIPEFEKINTGFRQNILNNIRINKDIETIYIQSVHEKRKTCVTENINETKISIEKLKNLSPLRTYLFEFLYPYSFNVDNVDDIISTLENYSGKLFYSQTHKLLRDRDFLIITKNEKSEFHENLVINEFSENIVAKFGVSDELKIEMKLVDIDSDFQIEKKSNYGYFDFGKIKFPVIIRKWKHGDSFIPFGMKNFKKISDYFIDNKINIFDKQKATIFETDNSIFWLAKYRIDNRFKIDEKTKKCLLIIVN